MRKVDVVTELLKLDNNLTLRIECHTSETGPLPFDMYFSVKRAEKVAEAIMEKGIPARKIQIAGYGPLYPIAKSEINGIENEVGKQLNNRVEFKIQGKELSEINIQNLEPIISKFQADQRGAQLEKSYQALTYKIEIASTTQLFDDEVLNLLPDPKVGKRMTDSRYSYTVGTYRLHSSAVEFKKELVKMGITKMKIIPFINGERISENQGMVFLEKYPDLKYWFSSKK